MIIRHFLSAYTLSSLSQSCVCVYLYSCSLSRTPWLHSDIHTHTSKHWLALSLTMRTLLRKRGRWLHSGHTYTQTPLHCHPPVYLSLSFAHLSLIEELRMRCTNIFHLYCHLQRSGGGGRERERKRETERDRKKRQFKHSITIVCHLYTEIETDEDIEVHKTCAADKQPGQESRKMCARVYTRAHSYSHS